MKRKYRIGLRVAAVTLGCLTAGPLAQAAWEVIPDLELGANTDDNPRYLPDNSLVPSDTAMSAILSATLDVRSFGQRGTLRLVPSVTSYQYADDENSELESTDPRFTASGEYQWQTVTAGFWTRISRERLVDAELVDVEPDRDPDTLDPDAGDTGRLLFISEDRERYIVAPYLAFRVSERNTFRLDLTNYETSYSGDDLSFRTGYRDTVVSASLIRNVDERSSVSAIMSFEDYEADVNNNAFDTATIEGAFTRPLSELWNLEFAVGVLRSDYVALDSQQRLQDSATTDYIARIGFRKRSQRSRINFDIARQVYPNASSYSAVRREVRFYFDRDMTQRLKADFGALVQQTTSLGDLNARDDRDYWRAEMGLEWAIKPVIFLRTGYSYTAQEFTEDIALRGKVDQSSIYIGVAYRRLSRQR